MDFPQLVLDVRPIGVDVLVEMLDVQAEKPDVHRLLCCLPITSDVAQ
jgi:hypothetical protein